MYTQNSSDSRTITFVSSCEHVVYVCDRVTTFGYLFERISMHQPWDIGTVPWDPLVPWYSGTGWTGGMAAPAMGHWYSPMGSPCPMVQWDGMDRWDGCTSHGTLVQSHGIPLSHGTVGRDGQVGWLPQPWDIGTVPWDPLVPWYSGTGWTGGMAAPAMGLWYSPMGSPCPMVQWDGMDRWDGCPSHGTLVQSHGIPLSHGTVGRDGQVGWLPQPWDIGTVPWDPLVPWYSGTGWTGGMAAPAMGHWYSPMGSPCPMVQWDGMDRWDGCPSHGTLVQSHGIPLSHGTVGRDGQVGWDCGTVPWDPLVPWYSGT